MASHKPSIRAAQLAASLLLDRVGNVTPTLRTLSTKGIHRRGKH